MDSLPKEERPHNWLFPQKRNPAKPIDHQCIPNFILAHENELGWEHRFTCHTFRHAFATYHYEDGTDLLTLKALMGHRSINSTAIYNKITNPAILLHFHQYSTHLHSTDKILTQCYNQIPHLHLHCNLTLHNSRMQMLNLK